MTNKKLFSFALGWALVLLVFTSVTPVFAAEPDVQTIREEDSYVAADCGDFLAIGEFVADVRITTFFDGAGNPIRAQVQINYDGTMTNSLTGFALRDPTHLMLHIDLSNGTQTETGLFYGITVPGGRNCSFGCRKNCL